MRLVRPIVVLLLTAAALPSLAADWPMWRCDPQHSAATQQELSEKLAPQWTLKLPQLKRIWPDEPRMRFDVAYEPIVAGQTLYLASPSDDTLLALDTRTAKPRWRFYADGPVRFAPAVAAGRVYFGSDDGCLYCLSASSGKLLWKYKAATRRLVLGNERLISTWPVRGAPVVADGRVYFAAGIWPFMGIFVYCLDAATGAPLWCNDRTGAVYANQPHDSPAFAGVAPQGYCAVAGKVLLLPGGRSTPAGLDRDTGELLYFRHAENHWAGDYKVAANSSYFLNCGNVYSLADGALLGGASSRPDGNPYLPFVNDPTLRLNPDDNASVVTDELLCGTYKGEVVVRRMSEARTERWEDSKGAQHSNLLIPVTAATGIKGDRVWLRAGGRLVVTAGPDVLLLDPGEGNAAARVLWHERVPGTVESVVAADGRLFVSTLEGEVHCFAEAAVAPGTVDLRPQTAPVGAADGAGLAGKCLQASGAREGYCLVVGAAHAGLVTTLARTTRLRVVALAPEGAAAGLRRQVSASGLEASRAAVVAGELSTLQLPPYFAKLIVVPARPAAALVAAPERLRTLLQSVRPYGGAMVLELSEAQHRACAAAVRAAPESGATAERAGALTVVRRPGALPGSDNWTHQYGCPANTVCSRDSRVKAPLGLLWFGGPSNLDVLPRHGHGPPEQVVDGRLFIEGPDSLRANDVYTGRGLWSVSLPELGEYYDRTYHQPGANALGTNFVATSDCLYVVYRDRCLKLDPATGARQGEIALPPDAAGKPSGWGYLAVQGDSIVAGASPLFFGGKGKPGDGDNWDATSSRRIVVLDRRTGKLRWQIEARLGFRHNAICMSGDRLFCLDRLPDPVLQALQRRGEEPAGKPRLLALDLQTGRPLWQTEEKVFGTWLSYSAPRDILLQAGRPSRDMLSDEPADRLYAYRGADGSTLWEMNEKYFGPPIINGDTIITQTISLKEPGRALSLLTGKALPRTNPLTGEQTPWLYARNYGCNTVIASRNLITFRSAAAGYFDLLGDGGTGNLGGFKSGCTSNLVAAGGVLNAPDYTRTCTCSYQNQTSLAFVYDPSVEAWAFNMLEVGSAPIRRLGLNFGAPGDRLADSGTLWLDWPSVGGPSPQVEVACTPAQPAQFRRHASWITAGDLPWVTASGLLGVEKLSVRLAPDGAPERVFTARLYFVEPGEARTGERLFDVAVQGRPVCSRLDVAREAGGSGRTLVKELRGVRAAQSLQVSLTPCPGTKLPQTVLCGLEIVQE